MFFSRRDRIQGILIGLIVADFWADVVVGGASPWADLATMDVSLGRGDVPERSPWRQRFQTIAYPAPEAPGLDSWSWETPLEVAIVSLPLLLRGLPQGAEGRLSGFPAIAIDLGCLLDDLLSSDGLSLSSRPLATADPDLQAAFTYVTQAQYDFRLAVLGCVQRQGSHWEVLLAGILSAARMGLAGIPVGWQHRLWHSPQGIRWRQQRWHGLDLPGMECLAWEIWQDWAGVTRRRSAIAPSTLIPLVQQLPLLSQKR